MDGCCNFAEINSNGNTCGIVFAALNAGWYNTVSNCYNSGNLSGSTVYGIAGNSEPLNIISSYNIGNLSGSTIYGVAKNAKCYRSYYLSTCGATDTIAESKTELELKSIASTLDKAFTIDDENNTVTLSETENQSIWQNDENNKNGGYPILKWQAE